MDSKTKSAKSAERGGETRAVGGTAEIERVLSTHPGVRDAAAAPDGRNGFRVLIVPEDIYVDDVLGRRDAEAEVLSKWRKTYDLTQFKRDSTPAPVGFNISGWKSTYSLKPIPDDEMREWLQTTVAAILSLAPKTLYEIGCGTGMLLMKIAPVCDRYVAVDFSSAVLAKLREQLQTVSALAGRVELMERGADKFDGVGHNSFDTAVINSAAQYFPNLSYLTRVLENTINAVKPGGQVFVGDVRSLPLLPSFAFSVELFQAAEGEQVGDLRDRLERRLRLEQQLVLSPAYFLSLQRRYPRVSKVEILLRRGRSDNEMSRYRYNAVLHIGHGAETGLDVEFLDWSKQQETLKLNNIRSMLRTRREPLGIMNIQNSRVEKDLEALCRLQAADPAVSAGEFRRELERHETCGIHPDDLADLEGEDLGFDVRLSWSACRTDGSYDAVFLPKRLQQNQFHAMVKWPDAESSAFMNLANAPGQSRFRAELVERILMHCRHSLPASLVPDEITLVDMLPKAAYAAAISSDLPR